MAKQLPVYYEGALSYQIHIEEDFSALGSCLSPLSVSACRVLLVTDENVAPLYLAEAKEILSAAFASCEALLLPAGEEHKNTRTVERIYARLVELGFDRNDYLAALGGGVVGDICGFAAATYMRGIRFLQIPTTLLSQVDSSIGGKTGVDFQQYKNMVGAFHMPSLVYSSVRTLQSLDKVQFASGMGEVVKHALIRDAAYYAFLWERREAIGAHFFPVMEELLFRSNAIKRAVVETDPKERGERRLLNFGHTLGHAIEKCSGFRYPHGQCVAWGSLAAVQISIWHGAAIGQEKLSEIRDLMEAAGLATSLGRMGKEEMAEILDSVKRDKKMSHGQIRFILLRALGEAYVSSDVSGEEMAAALAGLAE